MFAVLLVTTGLTGCIGTDNAGVDAANATDAADAPANASVPTLPNGTPAPEKLAYTDCTEQMGSFPVPASTYEDRLPESFSLATYGTLLPSPNEPTGGTAELVVAGSECQRPDGTVAERAFAFLFVKPPEGWQNPDAGFGHALLLSWISSSDRATSVYEAWGLGPVAATGEVTLELAQTPAARAGTLEAAADGDAFTLRTAVEGQPFEAEGDEGRLFAATPSGNVTGVVDLNFTSLQVGLGTAHAEGATGSGGLPDQAGVGLHSWAFDESFSYVELTPRNTS